MNVSKAILIILTMAGLFPDRPHELRLEKSDADIDPACYTTGGWDPGSFH